MEEIKSEYDTDFEDEIICPYCGTKNGMPDVHTDEGELVEFDCIKCEKSFIYQCNYSISYSSYKAPCLNDGEHDWKKVIGAPREHFKNRYRCSYCDKEKIVKEKEENE